MARTKNNIDASSATTENTASETNKKTVTKPKKQRKGYFYEEQEQAVKDYAKATTKQEKDRIFNEVLYTAFTKMIESIIRRYKLYPPDEEFDETFDDTMSFLMSKIDHFNPDKGYKAYSYCGTVCKNYLIYKINRFAQNQKRNLSYDNEESDYINNIKYSYGNESTSEINFLTALMKKTADDVNEMILKRNELMLTENEIKVGNAIIILLNNWEQLFIRMGSDKFNKSSILMFLKETTLLTTKEIRDSGKKYKKIFYENKKKMLEEGIDQFSIY